jgi:hypothetical protein
MKPNKGIKISAKTWRLWEQRDKSKDHDDPPQLSPAAWEHATLLKYHWLKGVTNG